jgi:putative serine protease PepD
MSRMYTKGAIATAAVLAAGVMGVTACGGEPSTPAGNAAGTAAAATSLQTQLFKVVKDVSPAIVEIQCGRRLGSGVVFDTHGDVVTNAHVLGGANSCAVRLSGGVTHAASVVGRSTMNDLAVVRLHGATPSPATFADSKKVQVGQFVLAMGNPLGLSSSVTQGIVSSLNRNIAESSSVDLTALIQTSAQINPGNSGGALVDTSGRVIGIPTLTATDPEFGGAQAPGIGFAIPSDTVRQVANSLIGSG